VTNYRVQQVLQLGRMPEAQLRFLVALATFLPDDTRSVRVGFDVLIETTGNVRGTVRTARRELEAEKRISSKPGNGRGHVTLWTVHCLPPKGVSYIDPLSVIHNGVNESDPLSDGGKGVNPGPERGSTTPLKGGQPQDADLRKPDRDLNRLSKPSALAAFVIAEVHRHTGKTITTEEAERGIKTKMNGHAVGKPRNWLEEVIKRDPLWWIPADHPSARPVAEALAAAVPDGSAAPSTEEGRRRAVEAARQALTARTAQS
jgi:hypothetical protein